MASITIYLALVCAACAWTTASALSVTSFEANSESKELEVENRTTVTFICKAEGDMKPQVSIRGQRSNYTLPLTTTDEGGNSVVGQGAKIMVCSSTDTYICTPTIGGMTGKSKNVTVNVRCAPVVNSSFTGHSYYSTVEGKTLQLRIPITAYPAPNQFTLIQTSNETFPKEDRMRRATKDGKVVPRENYDVAYISTRPPQGVILLQMFGLGKENSGQYQLNVQNGIGGGLDISFSVKINKEEDDETDIHTIIGTVCGIIGALGVLGPAVYCGVKKCKGDCRHKGVP